MLGRKPPSMRSSVDAGVVPSVQNLQCSNGAEIVPAVRLAARFPGKATLVRLARGDEFNGPGCKLLSEHPDQISYAHRNVYSADIYFSAIAGASKISKIVCDSKVRWQLSTQTIGTVLTRLRALQNLRMAILRREGSDIVARGEWICSCLQFRASKAPACWRTLVLDARADLVRHKNLLVCSSTAARGNQLSIALF